MASAASNNGDLGLEIKTRSVEQTLVPLVAQITTLVSHKEKWHKSERSVRAVRRVGQSLSVAVERFVAIGEAIAEENPELRPEMSLACREARAAGEAINRLTEACATDGPDLESPRAPGSATPMSAPLLSERGVLARSARLLLSSVTRVLVLADRVVIKQIVTSRSKVLASLERLENVGSFQEFVQVFSQFGNEMVEFAHLTGDRQNDLKDEKQKARMAAGRAVLEKCTMMLLTASKTCLRHPDCESARANRDGVFARTRAAMEQVADIVTDVAANGEASVRALCIYSAIRDFKAFLHEAGCADDVTPLLQLIVEQTEDFTDSPYTSHERRERILQMVAQAQQETFAMLSLFAKQQCRGPNGREELDAAISRTSQCMDEIRKELHVTAVEVAAESLRANGDHALLRALKTAGADGNLELTSEFAARLHELREQLLETSQLLRHVSGTEPLEITCAHAENTFRAIGPQIISAAQTLALHPSSKIARENLDVFCESWESQLTDLAVLIKEITDVFEGRRGDKRTYLSLPRPGKHSSNLKPVKPVKLDAEEQVKIAKLGLELRLLTADVDAETEKLSSRDGGGEVTQLVQSLSSMVYAIYLFTRGEGLLKTTHDLFHQAEVFSEEGIRLCAALRTFSMLVPEEDDRSLLQVEAGRLPALCQQIQLACRTPMHGKVATFTKVDSTIQETKNVLLLVLSIVCLCHNLSRKYKSCNQNSAQRWNGEASAGRITSPPGNATVNGDLRTTKGLEQRMLNLGVSDDK
ncbi:alpha-catulin isoform X1 [Lethenteron reissneri]|uniref:alpha-catulin isoform X1 n=1 Tax=Lethenteron reissneri TaxID=7753 RepID=UPI002AB71C22|nr:alpha-catulin isoform X1 [Lethenteron reissneri]XP_061413186.1 alpha-catulin isoform X1 [Lethenteron reissneri]